MPGSDLLSHGETPHYHRRWAVSLPSSEWYRVVPARYSRQANSKFNAYPNPDTRNKMNVFNDELQSRKFLEATPITQVA